MSNERNGNFHVVPDDASETRSDLEVPTTSSNESPSQVVPEIDPIASDSTESRDVDSRTTAIGTTTIGTVFGIRSDLEAGSRSRNEPSSSQADIDPIATSEQRFRVRWISDDRESLAPIPSYCYDGFTRDGRFIGRFTAADQLPEQVVPENEYVGPEQDIVRDFSSLALSGEKGGNIEKVSPTKRNLSPQKEPRPKKLFAPRRNPEVRAYFKRIRHAWETHTSESIDEPLNLSTKDIPSESQDPSRGPVQHQEDTGEQVQSETASLGHPPSQESSDTERRRLILEYHTVPCLPQFEETQSPAQVGRHKPEKTHTDSEDSSRSSIQYQEDSDEVQSEMASLGHQPSQEFSYSTMTGEMVRRDLTLERGPFSSQMCSAEEIERARRERELFQLLYSQRPEKTHTDSEDSSRSPIQCQADTDEEVQSGTASLGHQPSQKFSDSTMTGEMARRDLTSEPGPSLPQIILAERTQLRARRERELFRLLYEQKPEKTHAGSEGTSWSLIQHQEDTGEEVQSEAASLGHQPSQDSTMTGERERRGLTLEPAPSSSQISLTCGTQPRARTELKLFRVLYSQKPEKTHAGSEGTSRSLIQHQEDTGEEVQSETASLGHQPSHTIIGERERRGLTLEPAPYLSLTSLPEGTEPLTRDELISELQTIINVYMNGIPPESIRERNVEEHLTPFQIFFLEKFNGFNAALEQALADVRNLKHSPHMSVSALTVIAVNLTAALRDIDKVFADFQVLLDQNSSSITVINRVHRRNCCLCYFNKFIFAIARYISAHQSDSTGTEP